MEAVGAGLAAIEVGWGDPFGVAVGAFPGGPAPGFHQWVMRSAAQGQLVDVGLFDVGPLLDVMNFAV
jgi:hypothetical protein